MKKAAKLLSILIVVAGVLAFLVYVSTYHPRPDESILPVSTITTKTTLPAPQTLKIMSWNVQYMAGKDYVFFYDLLDGSGPDTKPAMKDVYATIDAVAKIINAENPDIILLQEMDDNARRTGYINQREELMKKLNSHYNYAEAWYWKASFVPHPKIMGRVGMKLITLSKYPILEAMRHQLPVMRDDPLTQQFNFKRAVLEVTIDVGVPFVVMNTHLDAFAQGEDTMQRQVETVQRLIDRYDSMKVPWVIGGDFNLLMPGIYETMPVRQQAYYNPNTELKLLTDKYLSIPSYADTTGVNKQLWFTHFPNDPAVSAADRTIDYIFYSPLLTIKSKTVKNSAEFMVSDHFPIVTEFEVGKAVR